MIPYIRKRACITDKRKYKKPLKDPQKLSYRTHRFIFAKLLKFQRTFHEKSFVSGFGANAPTDNAHKKHGISVYFIKDKKARKDIKCFSCFLILFFYNEILLNSDLGVFMNEISLRIMTRELCHQLYRDWKNDPSIYMDMNLFTAYKYDENAVNKYFEIKQNPSCILLAIMRGEKPIGELQLKQINMTSKECVLSIHLQNDMVKGKGYGTRAEQLAIQYAFDVLGMVAVNADTIAKNTRSQHVLEKVGFKFIGQENGFKYYRYER